MQSTILFATDLHGNAPGYEELFGCAVETHAARCAACRDEIHALLGENGRPELARSVMEGISYALRDSLEDTLKTLAVRADRKGLELACHIPPSRDHRAPSARAPSAHRRAGRGDGARRSA